MIAVVLVVAVAVAVVVPVSVPALSKAISAGERPQAARLRRSWVRIPPGHGYLSVVSVVCCQVEVSATS